MPRILVAGIGNIFLRDDAFGIEVTRRLLDDVPVPGVRIADFGIRRLHLAYELFEGGYDLTIVVDAIPRRGAPGTLYLFEPDVDSLHVPPVRDKHTISPEAVLGELRSLGGNAGRVLVVGCEPATVKEGIGLSAEVKNAVGEAVQMVRELIQRESGEAVQKQSTEFREKWHEA
jgi:hydrogenase maturation protease